MIAKEKIRDMNDEIYKNAYSLNDSFEVSKINFPNRDSNPGLQGENLIS